MMYLCWIATHLLNLLAGSGAYSRADLYERIRPTGIRHDGSRQFPEDYGDFYRLIRIIPQIIDNLGYISKSSQRLLYRWLMDAPVDQDAPALFRMLDLLKDPYYLDDDRILRLYETAA